MSEFESYDVAVQAIKTAILQSQYDAAKSVNEKQLMLYYGIGKYLSLNSRKRFWGKGAIDAISERLEKELPGLRGFSARNLRNMRSFYEEWTYLDAGFQAESKADLGQLHLAEDSAIIDAGTLQQIWQTRLPDFRDFPLDDFLHIGFSHHTLILSKVKAPGERLFYIRRAKSSAMAA